MSFLAGRRKSRETIGIASVAALLLSPLVATAAAGPAAADDPADVVVLSSDFEDGAAAPWQGRGAASVAVIDTDGHESAKSLLVTGRTANWHGVQTPINGLFEEGRTYQISAWVKLAEGEEPANMKFTVAEQPEDYVEVNSAVSVTDAEWVQLAGTYTRGADVTSGDLYIEASGNETSFLVDDIVIAGEPAAPVGPVEVFRQNFEEDYAPFFANNATATLVADDASDGEQAVLVSGRTAGWNGLYLNLLDDVGLEPGTYQISAMVKLAEGGPDTTGIHLTVNQEPYEDGPDQYKTVGEYQAPVGQDEWVEIGGEYVLTEERTSAQLYFDVQPQADEHPSFLVDDVVILGPPTAPWTPEDDPDFVPGGAVGTSPTPVSAARGSGNVAALTFDDGPNGATTERLLDFLAAQDIEATFCVIGQNITASGGADVLRRIVADGHTLCNHSTGYADMGGMTHSQVEADLKANLAIIRDALGDPTFPVPYFRAPNGSWGVTGEVAAALGMQPLGLGNMIADWGEQPSVTELEQNLRDAIQPGAIVLVHDGGGEDRTNGIEAVENVIPEFLADGWTFTLPRGGAPVGEYSQTFNFEDGTLQGWEARANEQGPATVEVTTDEAHGGTHAAIVKDRAHQGQGIGYPVSDVFQAGVTYDISAWIKFAEGETPGDVWLSLAQTRDGSTTYGTVAQFSSMSSSSWVRVEAALTMPIVDSALLYFETAYSSGDPGNTSTFLVDDVTFTARVPGEIQDLTPLKDTVPFPMGVAIDGRETLGAPADLVLKHFNQVSAENHMKVESFYTGAWEFGVHPQAHEIVQFAQDNDLDVYGHVLAWHSQTPDWFFQDDDGEFLTDSEADKQVMRDRLDEHIYNVAKAFADEYGLYGSDTNPFVAWDVVNEVVHDGTQFADGLRRSHWYNILGEEFIHLAFEYAEEYFNGEFAAPGSDRPIKLFINDYNTEQAGKQDRYFALVKRILAADTPIDGVGHQFHVSLAMPTSNLEAAIVRFKDLPVLQAVTELDVTVMADTPAQIAEQGHYYKRAFDIFRTHADALAAVTVWGLTDGRSWRSTGKPLLFDDDLQAKPAYYGAADSEDLPPLIRSANVFKADVGAATYPPSHNEWNKLRLHDIEGKAGFQLRWAPDRLTAFVDVTDATKDARDAVTFEYGDQTATFKRDGTGDVTGVVSETQDGYAVVVELPATVAEGNSIEFDVRVTDDGSTAGWNTPGEMGILTFVEELSYLQVLPAPTAPVIDGEIDDAWAGATSVKTEKFTSGSSGATAEVRTLWQDNTLFVLAEVTDPTVDVTGSDPWTQDSVEIYVDAGNFKAGGYRYDDTQIRISAENAVSFGTGDETFQANRVQSATAITDTGYLVEVAISLLEEGGVDSFHGLDFQVNDATDGARTSIVNWADPTGTGYQSTARWGVGKLVDALEDDGPVDPGPVDPEPQEVAPKITLQPKNIQAKRGKVVTLRAAASGTPEPTVQWQRRAPGKQWKNIKGETSTTLKVKNTKGRSGSAYRAVFTNTAGQATTRAATVRIKPKKAKITRHPKAAKNVRPGKKVTLRAKASGGFPKASVQWQQRKPGKKWRNIKGANKRKLTVIANHKSHKVRYRAVFTNQAGKSRTKAARITVRAAKPRFVTQPKHARVKAGKAVTFKAEVASRTKPKLRWYRRAAGTVRWTPVPKGNGAKKATLRVPRKQVRSGDQYVLIAHNKKGWTASKMVRIHVRR